MATPDISVIVPVYNRGDLIRYCLESIRRASTGVEVETIVVDDGSALPAAESIQRLGYSPTRMIRQVNRGLLFARLAGLREASGRFTLFLDSDDLVSAEKLRAQIAAMDAGGFDVSYTDSAQTTLEGEFDRLRITEEAPLPLTEESAELFISVQPGPHNPIFRTEYLQRIVANAFIEPSAIYNPVAEIWFYHNAATVPARIAKVPGPHTIVGRHPGARLTNHWERLGVASLAVMEAFARQCPNTPAAARARQLVAEKAFNAWRRLPRGFSPEFCDRELAIWRRLADPRRLEGLGGRWFRIAARLFGATRAGQAFRYCQNRPYETCRTMDDEAIAGLLATVPSP